MALHDTLEIMRLHSRIHMRMIRSWRHIACEVSDYTLLQLFYKLHTLSAGRAPHNG